MKYQHILITLLAAMLGLSLVSCKKYLETKSNDSLSTPSTLDDLQAILDYPDLVKGLKFNHTSADEYYLRPADWQSLNTAEQNAHIWEPNTNAFEDWRAQYYIVFYANTVLDNLEKISAEGNEQRWNEIRAHALFVRAHCFYWVAQIFAPQYNPASASTDLGIPLRLSSIFEIPSVRSTVQETYDRIISDLTTAAPLLGNSSPYPTRPSRLSCYALLARVYLQIGMYDKAKEYADQALAIKSTLMDFNSLDPLSNFPIQRYNEEVIFVSSANAPVNGTTRARIDPLLYDSFDPDDLRKTVFFRPNTDGSWRFKGSYNGGSSDLFNGLAVDELYLIRAESFARLGDPDAAMEDLNALLVKRWKENTFVPFTANTPEEALTLILQERRKELIYRGTRWSDIRRLNLTPQYAITLQRTIDTDTYELPPGDPRYTLLIPPEVTRMVDLPQNPR